MTVPIARVVATRYATAEPPLRFCYFAHCYRARHARSAARCASSCRRASSWSARPAPRGTAEALTVLCHALDAVGLKDYRVGLGDASLYPALLAASASPRSSASGCCSELVDAATSSGSSARSRELGLAAGDAELLLRVPQLRGGPDVLEARRGRSADALAGLRGVLDLLEAAVAERVIFDLGLARGLGYYTGAVFDVYDPALGAPLGGGGRYDDLLGRFGRALPAVGFALGVDRLHVALAGEEAVNRFGLDLRRAPRRAARRDPRRAGAHRRRRGRGAHQRPPAALRRRRHRDDAPVRRADLRRGGRRRPRDRGQGRAHRAVRAPGLRAARPRLRRLHDGARHRRRRARPRGRGAAAPGRHARGDEVPAHRPRASSRRRAARRRSSRSRARSSSRR